ncbi:MAG: M23 family metallopeptidase [Caldilineaceae bacterium]|nr:M23 family metallopeptidase [Caldilineaceae bacterium]
MNRLYLLLALPLLMLTGRQIALPLHAQSSDQAAAATPVFRFPVVADAEISGYFDHDPASQSIVFYDGRASTAVNGFTFACSAVGGAWVGCTDAATSEAACADASELWYDDHHGIDFEYSPDWRTGDSCDLDKFGDISPLIYAPAAGVVDFVGEGDPYNGNYIRLYHDLDGDGNYYNDGLRSYYLHFADNGILVDEGQLVAAGDPLGYGGATGLAWTPHLHFEVQRHTDLGWVAVDPFGWLGTEADPWYVSSQTLWDSSAQE